MSLLRKDALRSIGKIPSDYSSQIVSNYALINSSPISRRKVKHDLNHTVKMFNCIKPDNYY